ncbi:MAG: hypothetical protein O8C63_11535 [Candidatus Methanoperedens sp.]|nr:hypothetical protein [Candidatus Methanoperedens sp.]
MGSVRSGAGEPELRSFDNNLHRAAPIFYRSYLLLTNEPQINADERRYIKSGRRIAPGTKAKRRWLCGCNREEAPGE